MSHDEPSGTDLHDHSGSRLEALLREGHGYLEDDGFTERVLGALPPRAVGSRLRPFILAASALLAALVGGFALRALELPLGTSTTGARALHWLHLAFTWAPEGLPLGVPVVPFALGVIGALVAAAAIILGRASAHE